MHQALYRKWRPRTFSEVCGQEQITNVLAYEVANGRTNHAYLFCGSRGTGKTTCAKILAKAVNCEHPIMGNPCNQCEACRSIDEGRATDVLEMDAASNNGVDYIRDIRDEVVYTPSALAYRVYIIDEVHMLSASAFNALLKTLEEPPAQVIFILATTELQKIPATILSRCQRFDFRRIASSVIADRLNYIAEQENISLESEAALQIAKLSSGGMRDSISLLELCAASGAVVNSARVNEVSGGAGRETLAKTAEAVISGDIGTLFDIVADAAVSGDMSVFLGELLSFYRDMLVIKCAGNAAEYLDLTPNEYEDTKRVSASYRADQMIYHCKLLDEAFTSMQRNAADKRLCVEITLVRMANEKYGSSTEALTARIAALEDQIAMGGMIETNSPQNTRPSAETAAFSGEQSILGEQKQEKSQPATAQADTEAPMRSYPGWMEAVKTFERHDRAGAAFLKQAKASIAGNRVVIYVTDQFTKKIIESDKTKPQLLAALRLNVPSVNDYSVVCLKKDEMPGDDLEELATDLES